MAPKVKKARLEQLVNLEYLELLEKMVPQGTLATKATVANKVYLVHRARKEVLARLAGQVCITKNRTGACKGLCSLKKRSLFSLLSRGLSNTHNLIWFEKATFQSVQFDRQ